MIADPGQLEMGSAVMSHAACGSMAPATVKGPDPPKISRPGARHHGAAHVLELAGALPEGEAMSTAVIGATGRVGSQIVRGLLARGDAVAVLVRDPGKARRAFGEPGGLPRRPPSGSASGPTTASTSSLSRPQCRTRRSARRSSRRRCPPRRARHAPRAPGPAWPVPLSWPEALELLSAELGEPVTRNHPRPRSPNCWSHGSDPMTPHSGFSKDLRGPAAIVKMAAFGSGANSR